MSIDVIGALHVLAAGLALACGSALALAPKGTVWHRRMGRAYAAAMVILNLTALAIYDLSGRPNPFHFFALVSLLSVAFGWRAARRRGPDWRPAHATWMLWSYVGLLAAAASELAVRMPGAFGSWRTFAIVVGATSFAVCALGAVLIRRAVARLA